MIPNLATDKSLYFSAPIMFQRVFSDDLQIKVNKSRTGFAGRNRITPVRFKHQSPRVPCQIQTKSKPSLPVSYIENICYTKVIFFSDHSWKGFTKSVPLTNSYLLAVAQAYSLAAPEITDDTKSKDREVEKTGYKYKHSKY